MARVADALFAPFIKLGLGILIRRLVGSPHQEPGARDTSQLCLFRLWLTEALVPGKGLCGVSELVGTHYEGISVIYRMLGARVGKKIYWPGSGIETSDFDLIEIGDNVVFGSRSHILARDATTAAPVVIDSGAMIADRCVICPGVHVERNTVLGSGALGKKNGTYPESTVWIGSRSGGAQQWDVGKDSSNDNVNGQDSLSPFGKAFYDRDAPYFVFPLWLIVMLNLVIFAICTAFWTIPTNLAAWFTVGFYYAGAIPASNYNYGSILGLLIVGLIPLVLLCSVVALGLDIAFKWCLLGRRRVGSYNWDQSSYCQRWQLCLTLSRIRAKRPKGGVLNFLLGSEWLCLFFRAMGARIGKNVCLYPAGADPMMTEPDLVTIDDDACIDDASLVCHINTKGNFGLNNLDVGRGAVMRSGSRLLSGASMSDYSTLLEHTLLVSGVKAPKGSVWQGWPAEEIFDDEAN